jgi:hypothetical protein
MQDGPNITLINADRKIPLTAGTPAFCIGLPRTAPVAAVHHSGSTPCTEQRSVRALVWHHKNDIRCETVPDPVIEEPGDAMVKVTSWAICGTSPLSRARDGQELQ